MLELDLQRCLKLCCVVARMLILSDIDSPVEALTRGEPAKQYSAEARLPATTLTQQLEHAPLNHHPSKVWIFEQTTWLLYQS